MFGALREATGTCWMQGYPRRANAHCIDVLARADAQIPAGTACISANLDNLDRHHCRDLLLFQIHHPRWEFVYQPTYAAELNLIEPWWKIFRAGLERATV